MKSWEELKQCKKIIWKYVGEDGAKGTLYCYKWVGSVIYSTGAGWEHVSVAPFKKSVTPSWDDMCFIKDLFWNEDEAVIQIHPKKSDYVNNIENCLHLWRCTYKEMVLPPAILTGINKNMTPSEFNKAIKEAYALAGETI